MLRVLLALICLTSNVSFATETDADIARAYALRLNEHLVRSCPDAFARLANQLLYWSAKPRDWSVVPVSLAPELSERFADVHKLGKELLESADVDEAQFNAFRSYVAWLNTYVVQKHFPESVYESAAKAQALAIYEVQLRLARLNQSSVANVIRATERFLDPDQMLVQAFENVPGPSAALDVALRAEFAVIAPGLSVALKYQTIDREPIERLIADRLSLHREYDAALPFRPRDVDYFDWRELPSKLLVGRLLPKLNELQRVIAWIQPLVPSRQRDAILETTRAFAAELSEGVQSLSDATCLKALE